MTTTIEGSFPRPSGTRYVVHVHPRHYMAVIFAGGSRCYLWIDGQLVPSPYVMIEVTERRRSYRYRFYPSGMDGRRLFGKVARQSDPQPQGEHRQVTR